MVRRTRIAATAAVTWRDGVHITGTPIWCDARRRRDVCFASSAERVGKARAAAHGQLIGTRETLALLDAGAGHLAVPLRKPFTLGTLRLELIPSGRGIGAAALYVDLGVRRVLYAGAIRTSGCDAPAEVRACDAVVVAVPADAARLPTIGEAAARVTKWAKSQLAAGKRPIVAADSIVDALEVAAQLDVKLACSRALCDAAARVGAMKLRTTGDVQLRVAGDRARTGDGPIARVALAGGDFTWPFAATRAQLLAWIEQSGAREVYLTGERAEAIAGVLGPRARVLGPPQQMTLFREAR
ncbi:MAG TPA: hypothetical protein VMJ10_00380 [Kofleriaceae bacterium]|nr:hypothetical protein [Kofleriaceae bacterium]